MLPYPQINQKERIRRMKITAADESEKKTFQTFSFIGILIKLKEVMAELLCRQAARF